MRGRCWEVIAVVGEGEWGFGRVRVILRRV